MSDAGDRPRRPSRGRAQPPDRSGHRRGSGRPQRSDRAGAGSGRPQRRPAPASAGAPPAARPDPRPAGPAIDPDVTGEELPPALRHEMAALGERTGPVVARHLVMTFRLLDDDPDTAYAHARAARDRVPRLAAVREAVGIAAYRAGDFETAVRDLRAARRIGGRDDLLPLIADSERGLGRPERALELASAPEVARLDTAARVELLLVQAGARRDLGQVDAAVLLLQGPAARARGSAEWVPRLLFAYADALDAAGRSDEAAEAFRRAAAADPDGTTGAAERLAAGDGDGDGDVLGTGQASGEDPSADVVFFDLEPDDRPPQHR